MAMGRNITWRLRTSTATRSSLHLNFAGGRHFAANALQSDYILLQYLGQLTKEQGGPLHVKSLEYILPMHFSAAMS
jgi:hypothetical protein